MREKNFILINLLFLAFSASADTCDSLIATHRQMVRSAVNASQTPAEIPEKTKKSIQMFQQGYDQCKNGQKEDGMATLKQAIEVLSVK